MLGYDISWAGFNIIEVMSSPKFTYKRIGYLAGSQSFHTETEVRKINDIYVDHWSELCVHHNKRLQRKVLQFLIKYDF